MKKVHPGDFSEMWSMAQDKLPLKHLRVLTSRVQPDPPEETGWSETNKQTNQLSDQATNTTGELHLDNKMK